MARIVALVAALMLAQGCRMIREPTGSAARPTRPIEDVQRDHTAELMAIPGVVGVYLGASGDERPFIGVIVARRTAELEKRLPKSLEGYPVRIDVTGEIRPLEGK